MLSLNHPELCINFLFQEKDCIVFINIKFIYVKHSHCGPIHFKPAFYLICFGIFFAAFCIKKVFFVLNFAGFKVALCTIFIAKLYIFQKYHK